MFKKIFLLLISSLSLFCPNMDDVAYLSKYVGGRTIGGNYYNFRLNLSGRDLSGITIPPRQYLALVNARGVDLSNTIAKNCNFMRGDFSPLEVAVPKVPKLKIKVAEIEQPKNKKTLTTKELIEIYDTEEYYNLMNERPFFDETRKQYVSMPKIELKISNLTNANLSGSLLRGANFYKAYAAGINLSNTNLIGANLSGANLVWANFEGADLSGANLRNTDLTDASFNNAKVDRDTDFRGAIGLGDCLLKELKEDGAKVN
jgi:uncharacterized protein YjbI with pentapeptide repeats